MAIKRGSLPTRFLADERPLSLNNNKILIRKRGVLLAHLVDTGDSKAPLLVKRNNRTREGRIKHLLG